MMEALIGFIGVVVGVFLTELIRKWNRVEPLSQSVFEKRLDLYVRLYDLLNECCAAAHDLVYNIDLSKEDKNAQCYKAGLAVAEYCTKHELFISRELGHHCTSLMLGVADYFETQEEERSAYMDDFWEQMRSAQRMIREDSGVEQVNRYFRKITGAQLTSPVIERIRYLEAQRDKERRKVQQGK